MNQVFSGLLIHPATKLQLGYVLNNPPHALMLIAAAGSGKATLAQFLSTHLLDIAPDKFNSHPFFIHIQRANNKQDITIEQIRQVINKMKLKVPSQKPVQRIVMIENAQFLSVAAQNSLLKVLEEPPSGTVFILTATSARRVLPTIASRTQIIEVQPASLKSSCKFWQDQYSQPAIESAWRLSGGAVGLMHALLAEDAQHPLKEAVEQARKFLGGKTYQRLVMIDVLARNKEQFESFIIALERILNFLHHSAITDHKQKQASNILASRIELQTVQKALSANISPKLLGVNLVLKLMV